MRPTLVLLNGLPGSGKSTLARAWCAERAGGLPLALDIDVLRAMLGGWRDRPIDAGLAARAMALAAIRTHLDAGRDVVVPQLVLRPELLDGLAAVADGAGAAFLHAVLDVGHVVAAGRLVSRASSGGGAAEGDLERPLAEVHDALERFLAGRPEARRIADAEPAALDALIEDARG